MNNVNKNHLFPKSKVKEPTQKNVNVVYSINTCLEMSETSGTDTEFTRRRIYVAGLPVKISQSEVRQIFQPFGIVTFVHLSRSGHGFVTFEDEDAAQNALNLHGTNYKEGILTVQPESESAMPLPIVAVKRDIHFPKPSFGRGTPQYKYIGSNLSHRNSSNSQQNNGSKSLRSGSRGQRLERRSSNPNIVKILHSPSMIIEDFYDNSIFKDVLPERYQRLFNHQTFPFVASKIFMKLDTVSLVRSRLVSKTWAKSIDRLITKSPSLGPKLLKKWQSTQCSITPLSPNTGDFEICDTSTDFKYRNVLSFIVDENEIMVAIDNGNIEIYDRQSMKLTWLLVGQYSASPVKLDFNSKLIFVQYTCAFWKNPRNRQSPSCWWNIYCRKTKKQLRSIDRDNAGPYINIKLNIDHKIYLTTQNDIFTIDVINPKLQMSKILSTEEKIEAVEFFDDNHIVMILRRFSSQKLILTLWRDGMEEKAFEILPENQTTSNIDKNRCHCMSLQVRSPIVMTLLSNNKGSYEHIGEKPYVFITFHDLITSDCLRIMSFDASWMSKMSDILVPYDGESSLLTAKFSQNHLAVGFGSFSNIKDGALALWSMSDILNKEIFDDQLLEMFWTLPTPTYHWYGHNAHYGGINCIHIENFSLMASNACGHTVTTRCIEQEDETRKDNILLYDFWQPGTDSRRAQGNDVPNE